MKKEILVCAAVLLLAIFVAAPAKAATTFNFGVKAGVSFSNVSWSDDDGSEKAIIRPTFGAFALVNLTPMLSLQPEINYLVTGEWWSLDPGKEVEAYTYLHIPVLLRAKLMKEGKVIPFVAAGPSVGFLLSATSNGEDVKAVFKSTDFGLDLGAGAEFGLGKMKGLVDLRFFLGLTNNYERPPLLMSAQPMAIMEFTEKSRALVLTFGLIF